jgi:hypothetical protein
MEKQMFLKVNALLGQAQVKAQVQAQVLEPFWVLSLVC